jgi:hypothetical protein
LPSEIAKTAKLSESEHRISNPKIGRLSAGSQAQFTFRELFHGSIVMPDEPHQTNVAWLVRARLAAFIAF